MYSVSDNFKNAMKEPVKELDVKLSISDGTYITSSDDLISVTLSVDSGLLKTAMRKLEAKIIGNKVLIDKEISVQLGVKIKDDFEYLSYGNFIVTECKYEKDKGTTSIIAYDYMIKTMKNYETMNLTYPITVYEFAKAICDNCKLKLKNESFETNSNYKINEDLYSNINNTTYRDILQEIAQTTATTCIITNDNQVYFKPIYDTTETLTYDNLFSLELSTKFGAINRIVLSRSPQEDNIYYPDEKPEEVIDYRIENNQIMDKNRETAIVQLYNALKGIEYYGAKLKTEGLGWYEIGDKITIKNNDDTTYAIVVWNINLKINGGISEEIQCNVESQAQTKYKYATSIEKRITNTEIITDKQNGKISELIETSNENSQKINEVNRTIDEAKSTIKDVQKSINNQISQITDLTQNAELVNISIQNIGGNNLIKNSDMANEDKKFWQSSFFQGYVESSTEPDSPSNNMFWYNTTQEQMYQYQNNKWVKSNLSKKYVVDENNLLNYTSVYQNNDTRRNTICGRIIKTEIDLDAVTPTTHCFIAPNITDIKREHNYITLSLKIHNAIKTGLVSIFIGFIPIEINDLYKLTSSGNIPTIFEPCIMFTPDALTGQIQEHNSLKMTVKIPTKDDIKPCTVSTKAPEDTTKYWLAIPDENSKVGSLYEYSEKEKTWKKVSYKSTTEYFSIYDENENIWTYRAMIGCYYNSGYNYSFNSEPLIVGVGFGFYGGFNILWSSQVNQPENPDRGTYWLDETNDKTYMAKFNDEKFEKWEEITSQPPSWIKKNPIPADVFGTQYQVYPNGFYEFSDLKLEYGNVATNWNRYDGEIYSKNVSIDEEGVHIKRNEQEMYIDEDEITALFNNVEIFKIAENSTFLKNIKTEKINIEPFVHKVQSIKGDNIYLFY